MAAADSDVYVLRTHFVNEGILETVKALQRDFGEPRVFMLLDTTSLSPRAAPIQLAQSILPPGHLIPIDNASALAVDPLMDKFNLPGISYRAESSFVVAYDAISRLTTGTGFAHMWVIEYDVYCKGSFFEALKPCRNVECDFLAKGMDDGVGVRKYWRSPGWCWWGDLFGEISALPVQERRGCFFPVTRSSVRMLETVKANLGKSTGFCEVYFPCLCVANGLSYKSIPWQSLGIVRYAPQLSPEEVQRIAVPNRLYHPVKSAVPAIHT